MVILGMAILTMIAGIDTTWSAIGSSLWHLATHDDDRERLVADPALMDTAVEELLRAYSPVTMARVVTGDIEFNGCPMSQGDKVLMNFPAANRDPAVFDRADEVLLDRQENRHVAFGSGIHRCAGSNLARMELRVALEEWLGRVPVFHLAEDAEVCGPGDRSGARANCRSCSGDGPAPLDGLNGDGSYSRSTRRSPRSGVHDRTTSRVASASSPVTTTSVMSAMKSSPSGCPEASGPAETARPAIFASPGHSFSWPSAGWKVGPWRANRGSRTRSAPFRAPVIEPNRSSPSVNSHSIPEMRGEPSALSVAMVLWRPASNSRCTSEANAGAASSNSLHAGTARHCMRMPDREGWTRRPAPQGLAAGQLSAPVAQACSAVDRKVIAMPQHGASITSSMVRPPCRRCCRYPTRRPYRSATATGPSTSATAMTTDVEALAVGRGSR